MSYDLQVWARRELTEDELTSSWRAAGLAAAGDGTVVRGARARYCFHLDQSRVEPEDVPDEVVATVLAPKALYGVQVEGTIASAIPHATRFAGGSPEPPRAPWSTSKRGRCGRPELRDAPRVEEGRIDLVSAHWYVRQGDRRRDAQAWLDAARTYLPEALPRRFGEYEPLSAKYDAASPERSWTPSPARRRACS